MADVTSYLSMAGQRPQATTKIARRETAWGYVLSTRALDREAKLVEAGLTGGAVALALAAAGLWLWPGSSFAPAVLGMKLALTVATVTGAGCLAALARRGLQRDVQVDQDRRQVRVLWRNSRGVTRLATVVGFEEIGSVFLRAAPLGSGRTLWLRFGRRGESLALLRGPEAELRVIWDDVNADLRVQPAAQVFPATAGRADDNARLRTLRPARKRRA